MSTFVDLVQKVRKVRKHQKRVFDSDVASNLDLAVRFIRALLDCYEFAHKDRRRILDQLALVEKRHKDQHLYLGVVGEFTSGKSTLINAMLGFRLLKSNILQGTTCTPTFIRYGERFEIRVNRNNGEVLKLSDVEPEAVEATRGAGLLFRKVFSCIGCGRVAYAGGVLEDSIEKAKPFLFRYTAEEQYSKDTRSVEIDLPCRECFLDGEIVVVDTPGLNAENPRHQEVTRRTVHEDTDLSLVLTQAAFPCSETVRTFVLEHLNDIQDRCVGVVTQIDKVDSDERDEVVEDVKARFGAEGISFKEIHGISAISNLPERVRLDDAKELQSEFLKFTRHLADLLRAARPQIIAKRLKELQGVLVNECLTPAMAEYAKTLQTRKRILAANRLVDFDSFLGKEVDKCTREFDSLSTISDESVENVVSSARWSLMSRLSSSISSASSKDEVKSALSESNVKAVISRVMSDGVQDVVAGMVSREAGVVTKTLKDFHRLFNSEYRNLAGTTTVGTVDGHSVSVTSASLDANIMSGADLADYGWSVGGVAAGALAGTAFCPGIGTFIGGLIGLFASFAFWQDLSTYKKNANAKVSTLADKWYAQVLPYAKSAANSSHSSLRQQLITGVNGYSKFRAEIQSLIKREKAEQSAIDELLTYMESDKRKVLQLGK